LLSRIFVSEAKDLLVRLQKLAEQKVTVDAETHFFRDLVGNTQVSLILKCKELVVLPFIVEMILDLFLQFIFDGFFIIELL
jgi:hypothetical protein